MVGWWSSISAISLFWCIAKGNVIILLNTAVEPIMTAHLQETGLHGVLELLSQICLCCGLNLSLVWSFFELVSILFAIVPYYGNEQNQQKKIKIEPF